MGRSTVLEINGQAVGVDIREGKTALETFGNYINKIAFETVGGI